MILPDRNAGPQFGAPPARRCFAARRQVPARGNGRFRLLAAAFFLLAAAASLHARGAREETALSAADELINAKEYDRAISVLTEYMENNPDNFGEAQTRLQKIIMIRDEYNAIAGELLDTLEADPRNSEKIFELSERLRAIESPTNPNTRRFLDQVRYLAELNVNRNRLEGILETAREQLARNDFSGAMTTYASGLSLYQDLFFSSGYGEEAEDTARRGLETINGNMRNFEAAMNPFGEAAAALTGLDGQNLPASAELSRAYSVLAPLLEELAAIKAGFAGVRESFDAQLVKLQALDSDLGDRSFLSFTGRLVTGPAGQNEGMSGTVDRFWRFNLDPAGAALEGIAGRSWNEAYAAVNDGNYAAFPALSDRTSAYIASALAFTESRNRFVLDGGGESFVLFGETVSGETGGAYLKFRAMNNALALLGEAGDIAARGETAERENLPALDSWRRGLTETSAAVSREETIRGLYRGLAGNLDGLDERIESGAEETRNYAETLASASAGPEGAQDYFARVGNISLNLGNRFRALERGALVRLYTIANGDLQNRVNAREAEFNEGNSLIAGVSRENEDSGVYTAYYPGEGAEILSRLNENIGPDIESGRALVARYGAESGDALNVPEVNALYASARELLARLLTLQSTGAARMASARTGIARAASLRFEGDRLFEAARAALNRNDFAAARNNLTRATEQYNASLAVQESASLRDTWNNQFIGLGADIVRIENEVVVRDVRNLVTSARERYYAGSMEQAEEILVRAQNRWRVTNITEQQDVEYWLRLVRSALSVQSGRVIAPTAPLYAEMSQLLSEARRNYDEGVRLLSGGQRQEGLVRFGDASAKTREVRLIFPMNQEARMIELRIEQQTDSGAFNASFRQRLNEAVAGTKRQNTESYADLQDLAEINPRYPGIRDLLSQAEIDMGLRPPPPDPRALARSTELTRNAQTVIAARDNLRYEAAQTWLSDAINLNPNNTQAQTLMDQLNIFMTGTGTIILPPFAMEQYNNALQEYLRGNFLTANSIVEQLLRNSEYRKSIQVQELKRRIDAVL